MKRITGGGFDDLWNAYGALFEEIDLANQAAAAGCAAWTWSRRSAS